MEKKKSLTVAKKNQQDAAPSNKSKVLGSFPTESVPVLDLPQKLFLLLLMFISFPLGFLGTYERTGNPVPACFLEYPPQNCLVPKAAYNAFIYLLIVIGGLVFFFVLLIFPFIFPHVDATFLGLFPSFIRSIYKNTRENDLFAAGVFPIWGRLGAACMFFFWFAMWVQPAFLVALLQYTFFPLWIGFIFTLDAIVFYRSGASIFSKNAAAMSHIFSMSALGWLYFEFMGYFTQNWYYPINHFGTQEWYIVMYALNYTTIFTAIFEWADLLATISWFETAYSNGPKISLPAWLQLIVIGICGYGCYAMSANPMDSLWVSFSWISPTFFAGFGLTLVKYPNPWSRIAHGDYSPLIIFGMSGLFNGFFWEMWNYWSPASNPAYWKYDVPFLNAWRLFEMPIVGFLGYIPFGICAWSMWLVFLSILNPPRPLTWKTAWLWVWIVVLVYIRVFYAANIIKGIFGLVGL